MPNEKSDFDKDKNDLAQPGRRRTGHRSKYYHSPRRKMKWVFVIFGIILALWVGLVLLDWFGILHWSAKNGHYWTARTLILLGERVDAEAHDLSTPLHTAAHHGQLEMVKLFVEKGADINARNRSNDRPLNDAISGGNRDIAEFLLERGAKFNAEFGSPLEQSVEGGHLELVQFFIDKGEDPKKHGLLCAAVKYKNVQQERMKMMELLISNGVDVNESYGYQTPLHLVASNGDIDAVKLLVEKGAEINPTDNKGLTPLDYAVINEHDEIIDFLKKSGATGHNPSTLYYFEAQRIIDECNDKYKWTTPLAAAVRNNKKGVAQVLIENGADVNETDDNGETALFHATTKPVAELLVQKGANVNKINKFYNTPLDCAIKYHYKEVEEFLVSSGARTCEEIAPRPFFTRNMIIFLFIMFLIVLYITILVLRNYRKRRLKSSG